MVKYNKIMEKEFLHSEKQHGTKWEWLIPSWIKKICAAWHCWIFSVPKSAEKSHDVAGPLC